MATEDSVELIVLALIRRWSASGVLLRPGVTPGQVEEFERRNVVKLPNDLRTFYLAVDGMEEYELDPQEDVRFWPLEEVVAVSDSGGVDESAGVRFPGYFVFADFSQWAHAYAISLPSGEGQGGGVIVVGLDDPIQVASSFGDFLQKYVRSPDVLFPP